jgi:AcrR family transcriptional regulator
MAKPVATPKPKPKLTLDAIVDAAQRLIEEEGFDALSMRRLADRCGVGAMTLYGYVRTKEELLAALADRFFGEIELPRGEGMEWDELISAIMRAVYRLFREHPELADIAAHEHLNAVAAYRGAEVVLGALSRAGLDGDTAVSAFVALTSYVVGFAQRERGSEHQARRLVAIRDLPRDDFPHVVGLASSLVIADRERHFDDGLDLLIRGIASRVAET